MAKSKFKQYGVVNKDLSTLKIRMDEIPVHWQLLKQQKKQDGEHQDLHKKEMLYLVNGHGLVKE